MQARRWVTGSGANGGKGIKGIEARGDGRMLLVVITTRSIRPKGLFFCQSRLSFFSAVFVLLSGETSEVDNLHFTQK